MLCALLMASELPESGDNVSGSVTTKPAALLQYRNIKHSRRRVQQEVPNNELLVGDSGSLRGDSVSLMCCKLLLKLGQPLLMRQGERERLRSG